MLLTTFSNVPTGNTFLNNKLLHKFKYFKCFFLSKICVTDEN